MAKFDGWSFLRILEVILVLACLVCKRVTDDEAKSLFLYLQKVSREWGLLNNVTWDRVGSSVADATFGGYLIITVGLLVGKLTGELPTQKRITEWLFLGVGAVLFIVIGSLCFAAIDLVPNDLIDNAAVLGTLAIVTGILFLLDMGAPKAPKKDKSADIQKVRKDEIKTKATTQTNGNDQNERRPSRPITQQVYEIEREIERSEQATRLDDDQLRQLDEERKKVKKDIKNSGIRNGGPSSRIEMALKEPMGFAGRSYVHLDPTSKGYRQMKDDDGDIPRRFGIYGKDVTDYGGSDTDETAELPPRIELHTPVWSNIKKGQAVKYYIPPAVLPRGFSREDDIPERPPSGPLDPGFVQYTAQHWGEDESKTKGVKTPRHSPTEAESNNH